MAAHRTDEQIKNHEAFREEFEKTYYTAEQRKAAADQRKAAKKAAEPAK